MTAAVVDKEGREGFILGYSSGTDGDSEWEEVLVAFADGRLRVCRPGDLTFRGLMTEHGLVGTPPKEEEPKWPY